MTGFVKFVLVGVCGLTVALPMATAGFNWRGSCSHGWSLRDRIGRPCHSRCMVRSPVILPSGANDATTTEAETPATADRRYILIKNETTEKVTVYVQYHTMLENGRWGWFPGDPSVSPQPLTFVFEPGESAHLFHDGWKVSADRVRLWAVSAGGDEWIEYKDTDLWLIDADENGVRSYVIGDDDTFTFAISK